jgi:hypothetical protein
MREHILVFLSIIALVGCKPKDPIDRVVAETSANPHFGNGMFSPILLPATASPIEVAAKALGYSTTNFTVSEVRHVHISYHHQEDSISPDITSYTAVLVPFGSGQRVILLKYRKSSLHSPGFWWSCKYDL